MIRVMLAIVAGLALGAAGAAWAAERVGELEQAGYAKTVTCSACHGFKGNSRVESVPILAGMAPGYFSKAIEDQTVEARRQLMESN